MWVRFLLAGPRINMAYTIINYRTTLLQWIKDIMSALENSSKYEFYGPVPNSITMHAGDGNEMIRIAPDGFYVRGVKIPADDKEAEIVYNTFKQWLVQARSQQQ